MSRRVSVGTHVLAALLAGALGAPAEAAAQAEPADPGAAAEAEEIVVTTKRVRGGSLSEIEPEIVLNEEDIAAYGASSFGELFDQLSSELSSGRGRSSSSGEPVVLLNGRRVAGFRELDNYPVEALARVEVLPEEVSLAYGFSADQRIINFVLKPNVTVTTLTGRLARPQEGAQTGAEGVAQRLHVDGGERLSFDAEVKRSDSILESDRDIVFAGPRDERGFRTLAPDALDWRAGFSAGRDVGGGTVATLSGSYLRTSSEDLQGLDAAGVEPLLQQRVNGDIFVGLSVTSELAPSTWSFDASFNRVALDTQTDLLSPSGADRATRSQRRTAAAQFVLNQRLADLAAGRLALTASAGWSDEKQKTKIDLAGALTEGDAARQTFSGHVSFDAPFPAPGPLPGVVTLNANVDLRRLSDSGLLPTYGYGVTWKPSKAFRLIASATREEGAPPLSDLGAPRVVTPNARVFDFRSGEDALVDLATGGNPALTPDQRRVFKVGLQWTLSEKPGVQINLDYARQKIEDEVRTFALLTEQFEAAFPGRVVRDGAGALLSFDRRPVQVAESEREELRTMLTFTQPLKAQRVRASGPPPKKKRRSGRPGSLRVTVIHQWTLRDEVRVADGQPAFDFLDGAASGALGGTPAHTIDASLYRWNNGVGFLAAGRYLSATAVDSARGDLAFSDVFIATMRLTYEFNYNDRVLRALPFLGDTRVTLGADNVFDEKVQVTDETGATPINFQEDILNPRGRTFRLEIRRLF